MTQQSPMNPPRATPARDTGLTLEIESALAATGQPCLNGVDVCTHEGLVTLQGRVGAYYQKQLG